MKLTFGEEISVEFLWFCLPMQKNMMSGGMVDGQYHIRVEREFNHYLQLNLVIFEVSNAAIHFVMHVPLGFYLFSYSVKLHFYGVFLQKY